MSPFWVSWTNATGLVGFCWAGPSWVTIVNERGATFVAAVMADSPDHAQALITAAHDPATLLVPLAWRFIASKPRNWDPFCEHFPRLAHHQWPFPKEPIT